MAPETKPSADDLLKSEAALDRVFAFLLAAVLAGLGWLVCRIALELFDAGWARFVSGVLAVVMLAAYAWFAVEAARAATCLGKPGWLYGAWVVTAPVLAIGIGLADLSLVAGLLGLAPLHLKFLGILIGVSPLSLKLVLASQLRSEIHDRTFAE